MRFSFDCTTHGSDLQVNLNTTASCTGMLRVGAATQALISGAQNANGNDGDANLQHGIVNNMFEVLPVSDIKNKNFGIHISGEYFVNTVYLGTNQSNQASTVNPILGKNTDYASRTRNSNGHSGSLLDAFVYDSWSFGHGQQFTLQAGQQTLCWGQFLFFGINGIAGGQASIDLVQAQNLVNPQSQQVFMPVGQIVATYQLNQTYTIQGYYQYQWEPYAFQGVGSYFSTSAAPKTSPRPRGTASSVCPCRRSMEITMLVCLEFITISRRRKSTSTRLAVSVPRRAATSSASR